MELNQQTLRRTVGDYNQSCDPLETTLNNALVPYTGEQPGASASNTVSILTDSEAQRIYSLKNINAAVRRKDWEVLDRLLNSEISNDLTKNELINICENIHAQQSIIRLASKENNILEFAIVNDQIALVKHLINIDFFVSFCELEKNMYSPVISATNCSRTEIAKLLTAYLSPSAAASNDFLLQRTFLRFTISMGDVKNAKLLINAGMAAGNMIVDSDEDSMPGFCSPLDLAIKEKNAEMVMLLLDVGKADPNSGEVMPPLYRALQTGDVRCVELLLRGGATVNFPSDTKDCSYLAEALDKSQVHIAECLIIKGAVLHKENVDIYRQLLLVNGYDNRNAPLRLSALGARVVNTSLHFCSSDEQRIKIINSLEIPKEIQVVLYHGLDHKSDVAYSEVENKMYYQR